MGRPPFVERRRSWNAGLREHFRDLEQRWTRANAPLVVHLPISAAAIAGQNDLATLGLSADVIKTIEMNRPNLLLIGSPPQVGPILRIIEQRVARPIVSVGAEELALAERRIGTLVLRDANRLNRRQQDQLHCWVTQYPFKQVIATASESLFPLVVRNAFSAPLFFQLNVVSLRIEAPAPEIV